MQSTMISKVNVEAGQAASLPARHSLKPTERRASRNLFMAAIFSLLAISAAQLQSKAQAIEPEYINLTSSQLDQLVAPIALDPDPLVAQILIGSTFPDQVGDANNWLTTKMNLTPDQRATAANSMSWDPSIKGLIVFPVVLDSMAKNSAWTTQLGNAYYNQPDDVMDAIQAMRSIAYQSHALVATSQQNVVVDAELIEILPANPDVVFVQYYNPWTVFGTEVAAYPGYVVESAPAGVLVADGVSFDPPVSASLDAHFGFSFGGWDPGWGGGAVVYNHNVYNSNSRTVANHGHFGGHDGRGFDHRGHEVRTGYRRGDHPGMDRRAPISRPMPRRISTPRLPSNGRSTSTGRYNSTNRTSSGNRTTGRGTSNARSTSTGHSTSTPRSSMPSRSASTGRSLGGNRGIGQPGSAGRSEVSNHSISQNRAGSPSMNRPNSAGGTVPASQSMNRSGGANSSFAANRPMSRPASASNSLGGNQPANRPAAANRSFGGGQAINHPASMVHSGGAGFSGAHVGGGKKR